MSERRRSAAALSSRAHAFSVEALIGSNKKRKLRGWEEKELELSMESLATDGEDPAHCLDMDPGQCADEHAPHRSVVPHPHPPSRISVMSLAGRHEPDEHPRVITWLRDPTPRRGMELSASRSLCVNGVCFCSLGSGEVSEGFCSVLRNQKAFPVADKLDDQAPRRSR